MDELKMRLARADAENQNIRNEAMRADMALKAN